MAQAGVSEAVRRASAAPLPAAASGSGEDDWPRDAAMYELKHVIGEVRGAHQRAVAALRGHGPRVLRGTGAGPAAAVLTVMAPQGAFAKVFLARCRPKRTDVAIKVMKLEELAVSLEDIRVRSARGGDAAPRPSNAERADGPGGDARSKRSPPCACATIQTCFPATAASPTGPSCGW